MIAANILLLLFCIRQLICLAMFLFALKLYKPKFSIQLPENYKEVFKYASYIILAGSAGAILLDIDKFMIPQKEAIEMVAYYAVGVYIASVVEIPGRAMAQIVQLLEINYAIQLELLKLDDVLQLIKAKPPELDLVLTGNHAAEEIIELADLVTEMKEIKHPFKSGIKAKKGIDF